MQCKIRISHIVASTKVLGPGNRYVVWMQGCQKRCRNCINPAGQKINEGYLMPVQDIVDDIKAQPDINGVTISGGEPFLQFDMLEKLVFRIKAETNYDIMLYSGYRLEEIVDILGQDRSQKFFPYIDILIDGEYIDELNYGSIYRGSDNQQFYFFTDRYSKLKKEMYNTKNRNIEFELDKEGQVFMTGIPPRGFYGEFIKRIGGISK